MIKSTEKKKIDVVFYETGLKKSEEHKFVVIVSKHMGKLVLCRHKDRETYEIPGGHIEAGEAPINAAKRELFEETGAIDFDIEEVCTYSVIKNGDYSDETLGGLFFADIKKFDALPESEIAEIKLVDAFPENLTYPEIQPFLFNKIKERDLI